MKKIEIYTDGACSGNPGPGGWGAVLRYTDKVKEISGGKLETTNNQMELMAVIEALKLLKEPCTIDLYTDSTYVMKGMSEWIEGWKARGWKGADKKTIKNLELWQELDKLAAAHKINWHWVKGHAGHPENERCDALARAAIEKII